jgi:ComF family protein
MIPFKNVLTDFGDLFFPQTCVCCRISLVKTEENICTHCWESLPKTNFHLFRNNPMEQRLLGRFPLNFGISFFQYEKFSKVQMIVNQIKYGNNPELAFYLGSKYGRLCRSFFSERGVGFIVPVPLHPKKMKLRTYNQSDFFGRGLGLKNGIPLFPCLQRINHTDSQTKKDKIGRWLNVAEAFRVNEKFNVQGKSLMLVDDVFTTGATIEACAQALLNAGAKDLSVASLGFAVL